MDVQENRIVNFETKKYSEVQNI
ncbi:hypothetical protein [Bacillus xiapuensis]|uniref:Uncharacterized protein n=1 Tax=Bacillus xiapuensis TaxID=2014075 RepID=A0ABU6NGE3_9BACI|nr:hypothetical protein [Bacillus xiapuensis]